MPPPATAAPSVLTARPIQAPATSGSCHRNVCARNGRIKTSTTAKMTTSEETSTGMIGRARIAAPVAIAADTPQIEMPDAGNAAQQQRARKIEFAGGGHGEEAAKDHDRDLDVEFRPHRLLDCLGEARKHVGDDQPREQREDEATFIGQTQRPADAELL